MRMSIVGRSFWVALLAVQVLWVGQAVQAQQTSKSAYQKGVSAYFSRQFDAAQKQFALAVEQSPEDARVWYFKGLTEQSLGQAAEGRRSLHRGAQLEAMGRTGGASINATLERVQGAQRQYLELARKSFANVNRPESVNLDDVVTKTDARLQVRLASFRSTGEGAPAELKPVPETSAPITSGTIVNYGEGSPISLTSYSVGGSCGSPVASYSPGCAVSYGSSCGVSYAATTYVGCGSSCGVGCGCRTRYVACGGCGGCGFRSGCGGCGGGCCRFPGIIPLVGGLLFGF